MPARPLSSPRASERREQLLEAAREAFADRDYDEVSVDEVAERAGVSHGLVFQYFGRKRDLYVAAMLPLIEQFRWQIAPDLSLAPRERLESAIRSWAALMSEHPRGYRSLMRKAAGFKEIRDELERMHASAVERISGQLDVDPARPEVQVALRGWVAFMEASMLAWLESGGPELDRLVEIISDAFFATARAIAGEGERS
jgi:AcrR family transcriptional regulator